MAEIGDRIAVASKAGSRRGVITARTGAVIRIRWDTGGETSLVPGPGVLTTVTDAAPTAPDRTGGNVRRRRAARPASRTKAAPTRARTAPKATTATKKTKAAATTKSATKTKAAAKTKSATRSASTKKGAGPKRPAKAKAKAKAAPTSRAKVSRAKGGKKSR